jgi:methionyl-tRNA formyltransferase
VGAAARATLMRIALIGQAAFGESVYRALRDAGEDIVVVSSVRGPRERPDPLYTAAKADGIPVFSTGKLKEPDVLERYAAARPDLCVMAFVTHILPESVIRSPRHGTIEYHPSLLPRHRGRSAMHWAIRMGDTNTGLTVFWVDEGIDTGPILLQREVEITPDDTVGSLYFDKLYPMGVEALTEAVRKVREGNAPSIPQSNDRATYEHPAEDHNSGIDWNAPAQQVYDLIRGSNPQPGAHARLKQRLVRFWDSRLTLNRLSSAPGTVLSIGETIDIELNGGVLHARRLSLDGGKKLQASEFAETAELSAGDRIESGGAAS